MDRRTRYPQEVRERAVRMVFEHAEEHGTQWAAIRSICPLGFADVGFGQVMGLRRHWRTATNAREFDRVATRVATQGVSASSARGRL